MAQQTDTAQSMKILNHDLVEEVHYITNIDNKGNVHGEFVNGSGDGIVYNIETFRQFGIDQVQPGDVIRIGWTEQDYREENWDDVKEIVKLQTN